MCDEARDRRRVSDTLKDRGPKYNAGHRLTYAYVAGAGEISGPERFLNCCSSNFVVLNYAGV